MPEADPRKELYRLWFEFLKRAIDSGIEIDASYYEQWLPVEGHTFNAWWARFRPKLSVAQVRSLETGETVPESYLGLAIPLGANKGVVLKEVKRLLDERLDSTVRYTFSQFAPTSGANIKYAAFRLMLHCYDSELRTDSKGKKSSRSDRLMRVIQRYKRNEEKYASGNRRVDKIPKALDVRKAVGVGTDDVLRNYYRAVQKAKRIIANVARGEFPGKYT